ncbi:MAG: T9SS type A sorting domain-containing protein [Bacteroidota bacterium]
MEPIRSNYFHAGMVLCLLILIAPFMSHSQQAQESEPNSQFSEADTLIVTETISGHFFPSNDDDYYIFELPGRGIVDFHVSGVPPNVLVRAKLYNQEYQELNYQNGTFGTDLSMRTLVCQGGIYYARLFSLEQAATLQYQLRILIDSVEGEDCLQTTAIGNSLHEDSKGLELFPNPVRDQLAISVPREMVNAKRLSASIINSLGQIEAQQSMDTSEAIISVSDLPSGVYILQVSGAKHTMLQRFIKRN